MILFEKRRICLSACYLNGQFCRVCPYVNLAFVILRTDHGWFTVQSADAKTRMAASANPARAWGEVSAAANFTN
jgi:hypothetical protein